MIFQREKSTRSNVLKLRWRKLLLNFRGTEAILILKIAKEWRILTVYVRGDGRPLLGFCNNSLGFFTFFLHFTIYILLCKYPLYAWKDLAQFFSSYGELQSLLRTIEGDHSSTMTWTELMRKRQKWLLIQCRWFQSLRAWHLGFGNAEEGL